MSNIIKFKQLKTITYIATISVFLSLNNVHAKIGDSYIRYHLKASLRNEVLDKWSSKMMFKWHQEHVIFLDHETETNKFSDLRFNRKYKIIFKIILVSLQEMKKQEKEKLYYIV